MPEINVSELIVKFALDKKIAYSFGILSSGFMEVADIISDTDIKFIGVRHEQWAGHMADAYARITSRPQLCLIPGGPGITNMITAIGTSRFNYSPMLVLSDGPTKKSEGRGDFQDLDGAKITDSVTKKSLSVSAPSRVLDNLYSLYNIAVTPLMGPVHLEVARDSLLETVQYEEQRLPSSPSGRLYPSAEDVSNVLQMIASSRMPVLLAGEEVRSERGSGLLSEVARKLHMAICATHANNGVVDNSDPYYLGSIGRLGSRKAMKAVEESDLIIAVGSSMTPYTFIPYYGFKFPRTESKIIQVTLNAAAMGKTENLSLGIIAGVEEFLESLLMEIDRLKSEKLKSLGAVWDKWFSSLPENEPALFKVRHNSEMFEALFEGLPVKSVISLDAGSMSMVMLKWNKFHGFGSLLTSGNMGEVGFSIPSSIGAKLARPDLPSYAILGDGAFTMEMSAILTSMEYGVPIKLVVFDNSAWGSEKAYQKEFYEERYFGSDLKNPDLTRVARSFGMEAIYAEDATNVRKGIKELNMLEHSGVLFIKMENDYPTPVRSLDAVKRVKRGIF